ncbi:MAG: HAMP domain-containing histidine kinase [Ruminococcaceae bacterium]|nr:HAMP domain-containing histidine kinase [Oscillospiraceae bacterium]
MRIKERSKKHPKTLQAMTIRLAAGILAVWLVCMAVTTLATAQLLFDELLDVSVDFIENSSLHSTARYDMNGLWESEERSPGYLDYLMLQTLGNYQNGASWRDKRWYLDDGKHGGIGGSLLLLRDESVPMETAILYTDAQGNILHEAGDFLFFGYLSEETWAASEAAVWEGYGWIDLNDETDDRYTLLREWHAEDHNFMAIDMGYLKITGIWDGHRIEPVKMDYITDDAWMEAREKAGPVKEYTDSDGALVQKYDQTIHDLIDQGLLSWNNLFDHTAAADEALVTVYASRVDMSIWEGEGGPAVWDQPEYWDRYASHHGLTADETKNGVEYGSLNELLKEITQASLDEHWGNVCFYRCGLDEIIVLKKAFFRDTRSYDWTSGEEYPTPRILMTGAIRSTPLRSAMMLLRNVYIGTFLLALVVFWQLRKSFREHLVQPVAEVNRAMRENYQYPHYYQDFDPEWAGGYELVENYKEMREQLRMRKNEITRLETSLDYAKRAEAKRRQMTSNIAHELKTPLAVVHSYAEGLQEHIAEEKREQYLRTILSETERMDAMVLEMLDLSRLEAGKVKLARDDFDLAALAKSVFDALAIKAEEKGLQLTLELDEPVMVSADESRIRQVLENYASNAVKYTPESGKVTAKIRQDRGKTTFLLENESAPLPPEALVRVWDSFYRVDDSRTGRSGTGLGLAIAKSIVELHGGSVDVRNTKTGVEFRFTI